MRENAPSCLCTPATTAAGLALEPLYADESILAVAAMDETTAAEAIERIAVDLQPLHTLAGSRR
jgi:hypothetical protein